MFGRGQFCGTDEKRKQVHAAIYIREMNTTKNVPFTMTPPHFSVVVTVLAANTNSKMLVLQWLVWI
jgi:hypothetical protein